MDTECHSIKPIDRSSVHRICSGQVVIDLAGAVKELVENSLDAKATNIEIRLRNKGEAFIEVNDNGCGVDTANYAAIAKKHCTSKLREFSDLQSVSTFGFRGEALSSLCALSKLSICTRTSQQTVGMLLTYDQNGILTSQVPKARGVGTSIILQDLFSSLPVRRREFTRNIKREFNRLVNLLQAYAVISTNVRITCYNQQDKGPGAQVLSSNGNGMKDNIVNIFGPKLVQHLMPIDLPCILYSPRKGSEKSFGLCGFVSKPARGTGRNSGDRQFLYFNNRPVDHAKIAKAVNDVYRQANPGQFAIFFLNFTLDTDSYDVNVTPDKRTIMLHDEVKVVEALRSAIEQFYHISESHSYQVNDSPSQATLDCGTHTQQPESNHDIRGAHHDRWAASISWGDEDTKPTSGCASRQVIPLGTFAFSPVASPARVSTQEPVMTSSPRLSTAADVLNRFRSVASPNSPNGTPARKRKREQEGYAGRQLFANHQREKSTHDSAEEASDGPCELLAEEPLMKRNRGASGDNTGQKPQHDEHSPMVGKENGPLQFVYLTDSEVTAEQEPPEAKVHDVTACFDVAVWEARNKRAMKLRQSGHQNVDKKVGSTDSAPQPTDVVLSASAEDQSRRVFKKGSFKELQVIGQFNLGFIISKHDQDVFIIDQHAADEKYNFETLQQTTVINTQRLLVPLDIELTAVEENIVMENLEVFHKNGFQFEIDEQAPPRQQVKLVAVPFSKNKQFGAEDVRELICQLEEHPGVMCRLSRVSAMFASRACRSAIMIGTALTKQEMKRVMNNLSGLENPWSCPHGRPTMRHLYDLSTDPSSLSCSSRPSVLRKIGQDMKRRHHGEEVERESANE